MPSSGFGAGFEIDMGGALGADRWTTATTCGCPFGLEEEKEQPERLEDENGPCRDAAEVLGQGERDPVERRAVQRPGGSNPGRANPSFGQELERDVDHDVRRHAGAQGEECGNMPQPARPTEGKREEPGVAN